MNKAASLRNTKAIFAHIVHSLLLNVKPVKSVCYMGPLCNLLKIVLNDKKIFRILQIESILNEFETLKPLSIISCVDTIKLFMPLTPTFLWHLLQRFYRTGQQYCYLLSKCPAVILCMHLIYIPKIKLSEKKLLKPSSASHIVHHIQILPMSIIIMIYIIYN